MLARSLALVGGGEKVERERNGREAKEGSSLYTEKRERGGDVMRGELNGLYHAAGRRVWWTRGENLGTVLRLERYTELGTSANSWREGNRAGHVANIARLDS